MDAVIDPSGPMIVGFLPPGSWRVGGVWEDFITLSTPEGMDQDTLGIEPDGQGGYTFVVDPIKVEVKKERAWSDLRAERNRRLAACDWTQLVDAPISQERKNEWAQYRQELRGLPESITEPANVVYPVAP